MDAAPDGFAPSLDAADGTRTAYRAWGGNVVDRDNPDPSLPTIDVAPLERLVKLLGCPPRRCGPSWRERRRTSISHLSRGS